MKELFLIASVMLLMGIGLFVTLGSGAVGARGPRTLRLYASNVPALVLRLAGYGLGLLAVQRAVGLPLPIAW